jgi:isopenicillin N synthase-like dioxygenase
MRKAVEEITMQAEQNTSERRARCPASDEDIPILDLGPFLAGEDGAAEKTAAELRSALEQIGFFYILNHGVPENLRDHLLEQTAAFYRLPLERKLPLKMNAYGVGYVPRRGELLKTSPYYTGTKKPDVCEALILQRDWGPGSETRRNPWPDHLPLFRQAVRDFFEATEDLAIQMLPLYALALGLERDFFAHKFRKYKALNALRVSYMPPDRLADDEFNVGPHTDGSFMTLLATSDQLGLEILSPSGRWLKMPLIPNAFVVNAGDLLTRWSNGRVRSTPHRVINTSGQDRYSIPLFVQPTAHTLIDCLPTCCGPDHPPQEPPIACVDYLQWFMEENFALGERSYDRPESSQVSRERDRLQPPQ